MFRKKYLGLVTIKMVPKRIMPDELILGEWTEREDNSFHEPMPEALQY